jgi:thioester reductase-like protein
VLVTGVTGLIGGEIVRRLAHEGLGKILALIRPRPDLTAQERLAQRLRRSGDHVLADDSPSIQVLSGDVSCPDWGLSPTDFARVTRSVDVIVHSAADTSFLEHRHANQTNVEGVRSLIDLAKRCVRPPLIVYVSTAANGGKHAHRCLREEEGCQPDNEHFNAYTHSKAVAELTLRESGLPVLTLRPTIVLSAGLPDPDFAKSILWCASLSRLFERLPLDAESRLDIVDVGFVAEATVALLRKVGRRHDCYNLSAGEANAVTVGETIQATQRFYGRQTPLHLIRPDDWTRNDERRYVRTRLQKHTFDAVQPYLPFLNMDVVYDDSRLRSELAEHAPPVQPLTDYIGNLLSLISSKTALLEAALP